MQSSTDDNIIFPPTAIGVLESIKLANKYNNNLDQYLDGNDEKLNLSGLDIKVIGRGITAGLPISILLQKYNATVTLCHSKTKNIEKYCREADILVTAIGKPKYFNEDMVKDNAIVIDVGINSDSSGDKREVVGDVDINNVIDKIKFITPVPGGIGRMTVVMLMKNVINVWEKSINNKKYD